MVTPLRFCALGLGVGFCGNSSSSSGSSKHSHEKLTPDCGSCGCRVALLGWAFGYSEGTAGIQFGHGTEFPWGRQRISWTLAMHSARDGGCCETLKMGQSLLLCSGPIHNPDEQTV